MMHVIFAVANLAAYYYGGAYSDFNLFVAGALLGQISIYMWH